MTAPDDPLSDEALAKVCFDCNAGRTFDPVGQRRAIANYVLGVAARKCNRFHNKTVGDCARTIAKLVRPT